MYDGDGLIRVPEAGESIPESPAAAPAAASMLEGAGRPSLAGPYVSLADYELRARRMRSAEIARMIRTLAANLSRWVDRRVALARERDLQQYLSQSTDHADLERRLILWERRSRPDFGAG
jgi:hypothetical protein